MNTVDLNIRELAAIVYGEGSTTNNPIEMSAIAFAFANRARAWGGKSIVEVLQADTNYAYAAKNGNPRYEKFKLSSLVEIQNNSGMSIALTCATNALEGKGHDPSNGAYWWDGDDIMRHYKIHPKVIDGFRFGDPSHNIFNINENRVLKTIYWKVKDKKTGKDVNSKVRGKYTEVWVSTAAYGETVFWTYDKDYLAATGGKAYR